VESLILSWVTALDYMYNWKTGVYLCVYKPTKFCSTAHPPSPLVLLIGPNAERRAQHWYRSVCSVSTITDGKDETHS